MRQGNLLKPVCVLDQRAPDPEEVICLLNRKNISKVYTGSLNFGEEFLGLTHDPVIDESDGHWTERGILKPSYIGQFESKGIEVVVLDRLF